MPNDQGGFTYEEEQEFIARMMANANWQPPSEAEQTPSIEEQLAQGPKAVAAGLLNQNAGYQADLALSMAGQEPFAIGIGPPYTESLMPYSGPPPMEANADWNYDSGFPGNWYDYNSNNTTTGGGFFNLIDLYHSQGREVPQAFSSGASGPSTNNWRLLPPEYRNPRFIMRNGFIIDTQGPTMWGPAGHTETMGAEPGSVARRWRSGAGVGMPVAYADSSVSWAVSGWPGASSFQIHSTPGY